MASCEKCYWDAHKIMRQTGVDIWDAYKKLLDERKDNPCSPEEQAGQFWDDETQTDKRFNI